MIRRLRWYFWWLSGIRWVIQGKNSSTEKLAAWHDREPK